MDWTQREGDIKARIRDGERVGSVVVVALDVGGGTEFFPLLRIGSDRLYTGVRKGRGEGLVSFASMTVLLRRLRAEPQLGLPGGFGWDGLEVRVLFPGHPDMPKLGPVTELWQ